MDTTAAREAAARAGSISRPTYSEKLPDGSDLLAEIERPDGTLRATLDEFRGSRYLNLRHWAETEDGPRPTRKGITIKLHELGPVTEALVEAIERLTPSAVDE